VCVVSHVVLILLTGWRLVAYRGEMVSDFTDSGRAFGFFTFIAGTHVLGARLGMDGRYLLTGALLIVAVITWLVLGYIIPWTPVLSSSDRPVVALAHT
jgi:hypothetical protein